MNDKIEEIREERMLIKNFLKYNIGVNNHENGVFDYLDEKDYASFLDLVQLIYLYQTEIYQDDYLDTRKPVLKFLFKLIVESYLYRNPDIGDNEHKKEGINLDFQAYEEVFHYLDEENKDIDEINYNIKSLTNLIKNMTNEIKTLKRKENLLNLQLENDEDFVFPKNEYIEDYYDREDNGKIYGSEEEFMDDVENDDYITKK